MTYLLDTHVALWWLVDDPRLSANMRAALADSGTELLWSVSSSFELAVKMSVGKLRLEGHLEELLGQLLNDQGFTLLGVTNTHCAELARLPLHHRDPFDRMLVAQARAEEVALLSADPKLRAYDVQIVT